MLGLLASLFFACAADALASVYRLLRLLVQWGWERWTWTKQLGDVISHELGLGVVVGRVSVCDAVMLCTILFIGLVN